MADPPVGPSIYRRRVAFGECDAARIYFAPRAVDYAVEAVEAWFGAELGVSWAELPRARGVEATFLHVGCEFLRPLVAGQVIGVRLTVTGCDGTTIRFLAEGGDDSGEPSIRLRLSLCLAPTGGGTPVLLPREILERVDAYRARCGGGEPAREEPRARGDRAFPPEGSSPFTRSRRVVYGECGAGGTVYAPKVFEYVIEAIGEWYEEVPGISWTTLISERRQGTPWVVAACDYLRPVACGGTVAIGVRVDRVGKSSVGFAVTGYEGGKPCFDARLTSCFIDQDAGFRPMPIPEEFRGKIEAFKAACEAAGQRRGGSP
jgi:4-hydroxybenzoyl-CoA thioesterase